MEASTPLVPLVPGAGAVVSLAGLGEGDGSAGPGAGAGLAGAGLGLAAAGLGAAAAMARWHTSFRVLLHGGWMQGRGVSTVGGVQACQSHGLRLRVGA